MGLIRSLLLLSVVSVAVWLLGVAGFFEMLISILRLLIEVIEALDGLGEVVR